MNKNIKLIINNLNSERKQKSFFEKNELKIILDLYAQMVSQGSWKDYGRLVERLWIKYFK